jgi:hypothetical protein
MPNVQPYNVRMYSRPRCASQAVNSLTWLTPVVARRGFLPPKPITL